VPRDSFAMVSIRPADLWHRPDLRALIAEFDLLRRFGGGGGNPPKNPDELGKSLEKSTGIHPRQVERITIVMRTFASNPLVVSLEPNREMPVVIVLMKSPYDL